MYILTTLIQVLYWLYNYALIAYILLSWIPVLKDSPLELFLRRISEPYLHPFRQIIPPIGSLDISSIIALMILFFAKEGILFLLGLLAG